MLDRFEILDVGVPDLVERYFDRPIRVREVRPQPNARREPDAELCAHKRACLELRTLECAAGDILTVEHLAIPREATVDAQIPSIVLGIDRAGNQRHEHSRRDRYPANPPHTHPPHSPCSIAGPSLATSPVAGPSPHP